MEFFEYKEGNLDKQYGGIITDICKLPVGTKFYVRNGCWSGSICEDELGLFVNVKGGKSRRFKNGDTYLLSVDLSNGFKE